MLDTELIQARMAACRGLMDELVPEGADRPLWDNRTKSGNCPLSQYNRWVDLSNCHHLWEAALNYYHHDIEAAEYCASWPQDVHPEIVAIVDEKRQR